MSNETSAADLGSCLDAIVRYASYPTDRVIFGSSSQISMRDFKLCNASVELLRDEANRMMLEIRAAIVRAHTPSYRVEYPADWWQALKDRWFPAWAKQRWPVITKTVLVSFDVLYPELAADEYHGLRIVTAVVR